MYCNKRVIKTDQSTSSESCQRIFSCRSWGTESKIRYADPKHGVGHPWIETASQFCWREIAALDSTAFHTLMPAITFLEYAPDWPRAEHELHRIARRLSQPGVIERDPHAEGYVQKPLDWAPASQSFCRRLFDDETIAKHLAALASRQQSGGGWPISWNPISRAVEAEWRERIFLFSGLREFGNLCGKTHDCLTCYT